MRLKDTDLSAMTAYGLIALLDENYPRGNPIPGTPLDDIMYAAGKRDLIETLQTKQRKEQNG